MDNYRKLKSVRESAGFLNISERKLRDLIAKRSIKVVRIGSRVLLRMADLEQYIEKCAR